MNNFLFRGTGFKVTELRPNQNGGSFDLVKINDSVTFFAQGIDSIGCELFHLDNGQVKRRKHASWSTCSIRIKPLNPSEKEEYSDLFQGHLLYGRDRTKAIEISVYVRRENIVDNENRLRIYMTPIRIALADTSISSPTDADSEDGYWEAEPNPEV